ncbi:MAG: hypothetical protein K8W52_11315 [Deltaproteobacteria bacterium]|nr:hypothetical protein [Deltaproteobacteria bacterium]
MKFSLALASLLALAACGSKTPQVADPGSGSAVASTKKFDDMDHAEKMDFMKTRVMPEMGALFTKFDPVKYAKPDCVLCHGKGVEDGSFEMPNEDLFKLDFSAMDKLTPEQQKMAEFMGKELKPQMAALLGQEEYSEANPKGFGCLECHKMAGAE